MGILSTPGLPRLDLTCFQADRTLDDSKIRSSKQPPLKGVALECPLKGTLKHI